MATDRTMVKKVNVYAPIPIRTVTPMVYGRLYGVSMSPSNILKCLIGRATIHEILSDGSLLKLNDKNYNTVNHPVVKKEPIPQKVAKQKSAIDPEEVKVTNIVIGEPKSLLDKINDENVEMPSVTLTKVEPVEIVVENKPNLIIDEKAEDVLVEYDGPVVEEAEYATKTAEPEEVQIGDPEYAVSAFSAEENALSAEDTAEIAVEVDPELAELEAEIAKLEAEEAAKKES